MIFKPLRGVCFGGGTGLPTLLRGLRNFWFESLIAIVTVFDNSARSRRLRDQLGVLPPSDIGRCLLALSPQEDVIRKFLFDNSNKDTYSGMHILLSGGEQIFKSLDRSIEASRAILGIAENHQVLPVTEETGVQLGAIMSSGRVANDEPEVDMMMESGEIIKSLYLSSQAKASDKVLNAIRNADFLCIGPGSLYTSVLPNLLVQGVREAIAESQAPIFMVVNLMTEGLGMSGMLTSDIVLFAEQYLGGRGVDRIILNNSVPDGVDLEVYTKEGKRCVDLSSSICNPRVVSADLWTYSEYARHNSNRLASLVYQLAYDSQKGGRS